MTTAAATRIRPPSTPATLGIVSAATVAALLLVTGVVAVPDLDAALEDAADALGAWTYAAVAGFAFLETGAFVGLVVPGETAVVLGGVVAARGEVELVPLIGLVWLAAAAGDLASFLLGRRLGRPFLDRHGSRLHLGPERLGRVERFYDRHGGKAVLIGRFAGLVRAVSPFLAGASGLALSRFLPWSALGALMWASAFLLVGYAFSESFAEAGDAAARIAFGVALLAALGLLAAARLRSGGLGARPARQAQGEPGEQRADRGAEYRSGEHVEREVDTQVEARESDGGGQPESQGPQPRAEDRHRRGGGEGRGAVTRRERRVPGYRRERPELRVGDRRTLAVEGLLEEVDHERGGARGRRGGQEGERQPAAPEVGAEAHPHEQRALHPPRRKHHEDGRQPGVLEGRSGLDERAVELEQEKHERDAADASRGARPLLAVNGRASGIADPVAYAGELLALLEARGAPAEGVVTDDEEALWRVLRSAAEAGRRVILAGGDGTLHAAANAPLRVLPELALVPAGRANNIARALGIPTSRADALAVAIGGAAIPVDALRVATPDRFVYAVEAVSAGFQAQARNGYTADNSADLMQGLRALARAVWRYRPFRARLELELAGSGGARSAGARRSGIRLGEAAQVFLSNFPYFGFGFEVDPGADPTDGRFEVITLQARGRARLLVLLASARRGRHVGKRGVRRLPASRARLAEPMPLVADAVPLGTTTATVTVEPARLRVASPLARAAA